MKLNTGSKIARKDADEPKVNVIESFWPVEKRLSSKEKKGGAQDDRSGP